MTSYGRDLSGEGGGILVLVALWLPVLVLFLAFVIDVGNWFEHQRHLQTQADAAALAAAGDFRIPCTDTPIVTQAMNYAGFTAPAYNQQVAGGQPRTHIMINSSTYYNQSSPVDSTVRTGGPCTAGMIDVKLTEANLPWYFGFGKVVSFINAHARVEIKPLNTEKGALPIGVPDVNPVAGKVWLINEATGATLQACGAAHNALCSQPLQNNGSLSGYAEWDNASAPFSGFVMPAGITRVGVGVALSGDATTTSCGSPLVACYDAGAAPPAIGLAFIQGYDGTAATIPPAAPALRSVTLGNSSCTSSGTPYFISDSAGCSVVVNANLDIGTIPKASVTVTATMNGTTRTLSAPASGTTWTTPAGSPFPLPAANGAGSGRIPVSVSWQVKDGTVTINGKKCTGNTCTGTIPNAQATYVANDTSSGPVKIVQVTEGGVTGADSFKQSDIASPHTLVVKIGVAGSLQYAASVNDPIVSLRVVGNQNQALDCDKTLNNLKAELAGGCGDQYTKNTGTACPSQSTLWASPEPWQCVAIDTGHATNQVSEGMNLRILGASKPNTCTAPNHWSQFPNLPVGDPRIVPVFLTPFGSFNGTGNNTSVAVTNFAFFYVTGWTGQGNGFNNPCQGNGDDPVPNNDAGVIVGHFIKYVQTINTGGGGPGFCDLSTGSLNTGACVAVLTQ